jgi:hypothetical protein
MNISSLFKESPLTAQFAMMTFPSLSVTGRSFDNLTYYGLRGLSKLCLLLFHAIWQTD